ncbi:hypothetical protein F4Y19_07740 [Candidatus Poribacteria bacterium]|nr:hypothetical protein [Candidatus Poribacteria bacterium]
MRNSTTFPNKLIFGRSLKICVLAGLCCYVALLGLIELTHDHSGHSHCHNCHTEHSQSKDTCAACLFCSQHVSFEIEPFALDAPFCFHTILRLYEDTFIPLKPVIHTRSRAPPVFSTQLANYAS